MKSETLKKTFIGILFDLLMVSIFLTPHITLAENLPKFGVSDLLLPFLFIAILPHLGFQKWAATKKHIGLIALFAVVIFASIALNSRLSSLQDHFEIYKLVKYLVIFVFVYAYWKQVDFWRTINVVFVLLLVFNFMHYFDVMGFNKAVVSYYADPIHIDTFGLNSIGQPDTKRIIGTVGNPNNNAILFLFFVALYFPAKKDKTWKIVFFALAIAAVMLCQSRTGMIALGLVYLAGAVLHRYVWYTALGGFVLIALFFYIQVAVGNTYASTLITEGFGQQHSLRSRFEVWKMLWEMIKQKPILGYAPHKDFFYEQGLYAESGYVLYTWRYGFLGLLVFLAWICQGVYIGFMNRKNPYGIFLFLFSIILGITSITNSPFADPYIQLMVALPFAAYFATAGKSEILPKQPGTA